MSVSHKIFWMVVWVGFAGFIHAAAWSPDDQACAKWTAHMQGIDTEAEREAVRAAVAGKPAVRIAFANSEVVAGKWVHDDYEQNQMVTLAKYYGFALEIKRIPPINRAAGRTLETVYREAVAAGDIVCDYNSYWDGDDLDGPARLEAAKVMAENPDKLFVMPYGEIRGNKCPPTDTSLQGMAQRADGSGFKNMILTIPLASNQGGKIYTPKRRTEHDIATVTFVSPSGWAAGAGDTCTSAAMATTIAAWVWAARGNQPRAEEIIALLAAGRAYPVVAEEWGFTEAHLETLKSQIAARLQKDALGRQQLIYDAPLNLGGLLTQINSPQANPVAENEEKYQLQKEVVSYGRNYVTTEISAETDLTAEFELTWLGGTDTQVIAGARSKEGFVMLAGIRQGKWVYACSRDRSFVDTGVSVKKGVKTRLKVVLSAGRQSFEVDGVLVKESALEGASTGLPLRLLGLNDQGVSVAGARARLHRAKIYRATAHE